MRPISVFMCALLSFIAVSAEAKRAPTVTMGAHVEANVVCPPPRTCDGLSVIYQTEDYYIDVGGTRFRGTRMRAGFRVKDPAEAGTYAFVQFIRGGMFSTMLRANGAPERFFNFVKPQNSGLMTFYFPEWTVDSLDGDPVYWSVPGAPRTAAYLFGGEGGDPWVAGRAYGNGEIPARELYVIDRPSLAFRGARSWISVALEFRTCLFHLEDVPVTIPDNAVLLLSRALHCFDWRSVNVFDHETGRWRSDLTLEDVFLHNVQRDKHGDMPPPETDATDVAP